MPSTLTTVIKNSDKTITFDTSKYSYTVVKSSTTAQRYDIYFSFTDSMFPEH